MFFSVSGRQRAGISQARHAGPKLQEQRDHARNLRQIENIQTPRIRQVRVLFYQQFSKTR
jgi:hypothetical protein